MPSLSVDKYLFGIPISKEELQFGDLVFYNTKEGKVYYETVEYVSGTPIEEGIDHVAMYIGNGEVLHASKSHGMVVKELLENSAQFMNIVGYRRIVIDLKEKRYVIVIPPTRLDLRIPADLIEEIGRIYGYENVSPEAISALPTEPEINKIFYYSDLVRNFFIEKGFSEVYNSTFVNKGEVELQNPLASDKAFIRENLHRELYDSMALNFNNAELLGLQQIKEFEIGNVFTKNEEHLSLAFVIQNARGHKGMTEKEESEIVMNELSAILETQLDFISVPNVYEINLTRVFKKLPVPTGIHEYQYADQGFKFKNFSKYPFVLRDIAVFVPNEVKSNELIKIIENEAGGLLVRSALFDEFKKEDKVSYAYRLVFQSFEKTLTDEEINKAMEKVVQVITKKGWQVR